MQGLHMGELELQPKDRGEVPTGPTSGGVTIALTWKAPPYQQKAHQHLDVARRSQLILAELVIVQTLMLKNHGNPRLTTQPEKLTSTTA